MGEDPIAVAERWFAEQVGRQVRAELGARNLTQQAVADALGVSLKEANRKLNGHSGYDLGDLVALTLRFGLKVLPSFGNRDDLFPPQARSRLQWVDGPDGSRPVLEDIHPSGLDFRRLANDLASLFVADPSLPRRLMTSFDLRRHIVAATQLQGLSVARIFPYEERSDWVFLTPDRSLVAAPFVSTASYSADVVARDREYILQCLRSLATVGAASGLLVALLSEELRVALADVLDLGFKPESTFELHGNPIAISGSLRAFAPVSDELMTVFEVGAGLDRPVPPGVSQALVPRKSIKPLKENEA